MKKLPLTFQKYGYRFAQVRRSENKAIYRQCIGERLVGYEVIKIRIRPKRYNTILKRKEPDKEVYPSKEEWGNWGWSCGNLEKALSRYNTL